MYVVKAPMHPRENADCTTSYRVRWRQQDASGAVRQKTQTFEDSVSGERFRRNIEKFGPARAFEIIGIEDTPGEGGRTLLPGVRAPRHTPHRRRGGDDPSLSTVMANHLSEIGSLPLTAITDTTISGWIQWLQFEVGNAGKTIANKHGFLYAVLERARNEMLIADNPCADTQLPDQAPRSEPRFLSRDEFAALLAATPDYWKPLMRWLVATGMRFSEATAVEHGDIDRHSGTCRVVRAWKYTGTGAAQLGTAKTKMGRRTINAAAKAIDDAGVGSATSLVFSTPTGFRVSYPRFYESAWEKAVAGSGVQCKPHDLRHRCASWMIQAGVPLPVSQANLGHESITTTIHVYGHLDRTSHRTAAAAVDAMI